MEWYVYYYDINHGNIVTYNIFDHGSFKEDFNKFIQKPLYCNMYNLLLLSLLIILVIRLLVPMKYCFF